MISTAHDNQNRTVPRRVPTIGVGYVDGEHGREALRAAYALTHALGGHLRIISVIEPSLWMYGEVRAALPADGGTDLQDVQGEQQLRVERELETLVDAFGDDITAEIETFVGDAAETLVRVSENLDVLFCGSRGRGAIRSVVLGSVSRRVTAEAHCPVVVLPPGVVTPLAGRRLDAALTAS